MSLAQLISANSYWQWLFYSIWYNTSIKIVLREYWFNFSLSFTSGGIKKIWIFCIKNSFIFLSSICYADKQNKSNFEFYFSLIKSIVNRSFFVRIIYAQSYHTHTHGYMYACIFMHTNKTFFSSFSYFSIIFFLLCVEVKTKSMEFGMMKICIQAHINIIIWKWIHGIFVVYLYTQPHLLCWLGDFNPLSISIGEKKNYGVLVIW